MSDANNATNRSISLAAPVVVVVVVVVVAVVVATFNLSQNRWKNERNWVEWEFLLLNQVNSVFNVNSVFAFLGFFYFKDGKRKGN